MEKWLRGCYVAWLIKSTRFDVSSRAVTRLGLARRSVGREVPLNRALTVLRTDEADQDAIRQY
jgi:hypothetical protein